MKHCTLKGCERPLNSWGLCNAHYQRIYVKGKKDYSPIKEVTKPGAAKDFLDKCLQEDTNKCIEWKFSKNPKGYGMISVGGKYQAVHRYVLKLTQGDKKGLHALHNCHNRSCFNPKHLRWGTNQDNMNDRHVVDNYKQKLEKEQVLEIRKSSKTEKTLAEMYSVHTATINDIKHRRTWKHV